LKLTVLLTLNLHRSFASTKTIDRTRNLNKHKEHIIYLPYYKAHDDDDDDDDDNERNFGVKRSPIMSIVSACIFCRMLIIGLSLILLLRESTSFSLNSMSTVATDTLSQYPWPDKKSTDDKILFQYQSHYSYHPKEIVNHEYWQELCPPPSPKKTFFPPISFRQQSSHNQPLSSLDISITWAPDDEDPCDVARKIVQDCLRSQKN